MTPTATEIAGVQRSVEWSNHVFRSAGVQFFARSLEGYDLSSFANLDGMNRVSWFQVGSQLLQLFPWTTAQDADDGLLRYNGDWLAYMTMRFGKDDEINIFVGNWGGAGCPPQVCREIFLGNTMLGFDQAGDLAHELGHHYGLPHPFDGAGGVDPETGQLAKLSDYWDLVYEPGLSSHSYFASRTAAQAREPFLKTINVRPSGSDNCVRLADGKIFCAVGDSSVSSFNEFISSPDPRLVGFYFEGNDVHNPPNSYRYGSNVMTYISKGDPAPHGLSQSQVRMLRKFLRFETTVTQNDNGRYGSVIYEGRRTREGIASARQPAFDLDFDGDGRRDLGVWYPPNAVGGQGTYRIWLSGGAFPPAPLNYITRSGGALGDIPVPADYSGDNRTDMAFYSTPGYSITDQSYWRWCPTSGTTSATPDCGTSAWSSQQWGIREDIPFPGHRATFSPTPKDGLLVYRPSVGTFFWKDQYGSTLSRGAFGAGKIPLVARFDNDAYADFAVYDMSTVTFTVLASSSSWNTPVSHTALLNFRPNGTGVTSENRSMGVPVLNVLTNGSVARRSALSLWDSWSGMWGIFWDPYYSNDFSYCQWGDPNDMPLGGLGFPLNTASTGRSDMTVFRNDLATSVDGHLYRRAYNASAYFGCGAARPSVNTSATPANWQVFAVGDMTGDGKAEMIQFYPQKMSMWIYTSESEYATGFNVNLGGTQGVLF